MNEKIKNIELVLEDIKAKDIIVLDVQNMTPISDYMIIVTGNSDRHAKAIANNVIGHFKQQKSPIEALEGMDSCEWILVSSGGIDVHIMIESARKFYNLEKLWDK